MKKRTLLEWAAVSCVGAVVSPRAYAGPKIRMAYFEKFAPLSVRDVQGNMGGALVDAVQSCGKACDIRFEHIGFPWARAQTMVEHGELDGFCTVRTQARLAYASFCETPMITDFNGIFHRADDLRPLSIRSVADMRAFRQGTYRGNGYAQEYLEMDRMTVDNDQESILRMIALERLDVFVGSEIVVKYIARQLGLSGKLRFTPITFLPSTEFRFGIRRSHSDANAIVACVESETRAAQKSGALATTLNKYRQL